MSGHDRDAHAGGFASSPAGSPAGSSASGVASRPVEDGSRLSAGMSPPRVVVRAFSLWLFVVVLGVVEMIASVADGGATFAGYGPTAQVASVLRVVVIIVVAVVSVGWWVVEVVAAFRLRAGRRGARVVLTVLGSITLLVNVLSLAADGFDLATSTDETSVSGIVDGVLLLAQTVLVVAALVLMHRRAAGAYLQPAPAPAPAPAAVPDASGADGAAASGTRHPHPDHVPTRKDESRP